MPPQSIYERMTLPTLPPPDRRQRHHQVQKGESLISIATLEYRLDEYDPDLWRAIGEANGIENPFTLYPDYATQPLRIPVRPLPGFSS